MSRSITAIAFNSSSDRRLKEDIHPLPNVLAAVDQLHGVYYRFKSPAPDGKVYPQTRQIGVIAQDVQKVYPELVSTQPSGYLAVDYPKLTAVLIEAIKELKQQNADLQARVQKVEESLRVSQLKSSDHAAIAKAGR